MHKEDCSLYAAMELSSSFSVLGNLLRLVRNESSCSPWSFSAPSSEDLAWVSNQVDPTRFFMIFHADHTCSWESRCCMTSMAPPVSPVPQSFAWHLPVIPRTPMIRFTLTTPVPQSSVWGSSQLGCTLDVTCSYSNVYSTYQACDPIFCDQFAERLRDLLDLWRRASFS